MLAVSSCLFDKEDAMQMFIGSSYEDRQYQEIKLAALSCISAPIPSLAKWIQEAIDAQHNAYPHMDRDTYLRSFRPASE
jgi:hypothetical protein